ncbi:MAG: APC family permease [Frankiaceae bacterium]
MSSAAGAPATLVRRLGLADAVVIGLGAMIGTGVFVVFAPAAAAAGTGLLVGLLVAAAVAYANATSSARLAARYPASGGTYVYGRERLGHLWGYLAGTGFMAGKIASCGAAALAVGVYTAPGHSRFVGAAAVVVITGVNFRGITKTARLSRLLLASLLAVLALVVVASLAGARPGAAELAPWFPGGVRGVLHAAGLLFFAFAGYARIATLGGEVRDPARTIPRAVPVSLGVALAVYAAVAASALLALGPAQLAASPAPLAAAVGSGPLHALTPVVRVGGAVAALGVLLSLVAAVSRTGYAMASEGDLPRWFAAVHPRFAVPHHAELTVGAVTVAVVLAGGLTTAVGFSAFTILGYYAITNACALTLPRAGRWPFLLALFGLVGCLVLAVNLTWPVLVAGTGLYAAAALGYLAVRSRRLRRRSGGSARASRLHRAHGEAGDEPAEEQVEHERHRQGDEHRGGFQ